jgi:hypothetical protein
MIYHFQDKPEERGRERERRESVAGVLREAIFKGDKKTNIFLRL